ncbi:beta-1,6-galactofuranosyltransferase [Lactobacillus sp. YT155]|uniref:beta-1,6-galactofuranosyltransferase n=1 Tax=Lactobacillus sp. YT155 TaxID=3060955 RepID=UPI00265F336A|nr:beta-1,6-galactofuranosyltransferase [Lactobacillus sp. YT155]MDO1605357.1 beta-1,6-galactofuranosyltransferase [Lactobacillus sp. YT155]
MEKYITNLYGHDVNSTAMNAQHLVSDIGKKEGYRELAIPSFRTADDTDIEIEKRVDGILTPLWPENLVVAQMPTWNGIAFDEVFLTRLSERVDKLVVFIHDFVPLMFENNYYLMERYLAAYNRAQLVIVPTEKMAQKLVSEGLTTPYIIQGIWDHLTPLVQLGKPEFERRLNFAGNINRFPFVNEWDKEIQLDIFSDPVGNDGIILDTEVRKMKGFMRDDLLLHELNKGGFGLVWSEDIENQAEREYSTMNVSFKFSAYLAAGIPLIVNEGLGKQAFVEKNQIGYVAKTLDDAVNYVKNISETEYEQLVLNVSQVSWLVQDGFFTRKLLVEIEEYLLLKH